jgi:hypothetical protein
VTVQCGAQMAVVEWVCCQHQAAGSMSSSPTMPCSQLATTMNRLVVDRCQASASTSSAALIMDMLCKANVAGFRGCTGGICLAHRHQQQK